MKRIESFEHKLNRLPLDELLPLLCASAVAKNYNLFRIILQHLKNRKIKQQLVYESLLQNYLYAGFPSALVSLKILREYYTDGKQYEPESSNINELRKRGVTTCKKIYSRKFGKLIMNIKSFSPEMAEWLILEGYGKVISRKGLPLKQRELNTVAVLSVQQFEEQLYSHVNGAFRQKAGILKIKKVILNLKLLGDDKFSKFGIKVLNKYLKNKGAD